MATFLQGLNDAFRALDCAVLSGADYVFGSIDRLTGTVDPTASNVINALRRLRGCDPADDPEPPDPPFFGGQCPGVEYGVQGQRINEDGTVASSFNNPCGNFRFGPITPRTFVDGETRRLGYDYSTSAGARLFAEVWTSGPDSTSRVNITNITRCDGQPDDCGNVPTPSPPPTNINTNIDVTYNIEGDTEVTVNIPVIIAPFYFSPSGTFNFPFSFNLGGLEFTGNFTLDPEFNLTINLPTPPEVGPDPVTDLPEGDPEDEVEIAPPGEKIIGVAVSATIVGEQQLTTIATVGMPPILAPRAGSIKFAYSFGVATFWSDDIDVKTGRNFIPCPYSQGADAVVVSPAPGVAVQWVPITGPPLATVADLK